VAIKVTANKVVDAVLGHGMQVLELVHGRELDYIQAIGQYSVYTIKDVCWSLCRSS
jgi:hypothetical protein